MSDNKPSTQEIGRKMAQAFTDAAEAMRKFAEVWNDGPTAPSYPLMAGIQVRKVSEEVERTGSLSAIHRPRWLITSQPNPHLRHEHWPLGATEPVLMSDEREIPPPSA